MNKYLSPIAEEVKFIATSVIMSSYEAPAETTEEPFTPGDDGEGGISGVH